MAESEICHGGPMDGLTVTCSAPAGFVAADRPACKAWIYDRADDGFHAREPEGRDLDLDKRLHTALENHEWDVIAVPCLGLTADLVDADEDDGAPEGGL